LLASQNIPHGRLLFCERPVVALQSTGNVHKGVLVCGYCMSFCGTPQQALEIAADPTCLPTITTSRNDNHLNLIPCRHYCGHVYCSKECQEDDWVWGGHADLCTGWIEDEAHPLLKFKQHAIETNEIFLIVAAWIARLHLQKVSYPESSDDGLADFCMNPWWQVACLPLQSTPMGFTEAFQLEASLRKLCDESHSHLQAAWSQYKSEWLTPLGMSKLIGSLEQNW
jgi:hypothetical protein